MSALNNSPLVKYNLTKSLYVVSRGGSGIVVVVVVVVVVSVVVVVVVVVFPLPFPKGVALDVTKKPAMNEATIKMMITHPFIAVVALRD